MATKSLWVTLRQSVAEIEQRSGYTAFDSIVQRTLEWVVEEEERGRPVYIQTVILRSAVASPASLHEALRLLHDRGFLNMTIDPADTRRRIITTTAKTKTLMARLAAEVMKVVDQIR